MADLMVRVIRTYHTVVQADYGDTPESIQQKAIEAVKPQAKPDSETVVLLDQLVDGEWERHSADALETEVETPARGEPRSGYPSPEEIQASIANPKDSMDEPPPLPGGDA